MKIYNIPNCKYYVTEEGRLFNKKTNKEFIPKVNKHGYIQIKFNYKQCLLHRIIAEAFVPNPEHKPEVDHINRIKTDNRADNLQWVTRSENCYNKHNNLPVGERKCDMDEKTYKRLRIKESIKKRHK